MKKYFNIIGSGALVIALVGVGFYAGGKIGDKTTLTKDEIAQRGQSGRPVPPGIINGAPTALAATEGSLGTWKMSKCVIAVNGDEREFIGPAEWIAKYTINNVDYYEKWTAVKFENRTDGYYGFSYGIRENKKGIWDECRATAVGGTGITFAATGMYGWMRGSDGYTGYSIPVRWTISESNDTEFNLYED